MGKAFVCEHDGELHKGTGTKVYLKTGVTGFSSGTTQWSAELCEDHYNELIEMLEDYTNGEQE